MVRFKNRYLLLEIMPDSRFAPSSSTAMSFDASDAYRSIWHAFCTMHGDFGAGAAKFSISVKVFNEATNILVVRIARECYHMLATSVQFVTKIGKQPATLKTLHVGGSIRSCEKALLKHHRLGILASLPKAKTVIERKQLLAAIADSSG